jgi:hypothetical protein
MKIKEAVANYQKRAAVSGVMKQSASGVITKRRADAILPVDAVNAIPNVIQRFLRDWTFLHSQIYKDINLSFKDFTYLDDTTAYSFLKSSPLPITLDLSLDYFGTFYRDYYDSLSVSTALFPTVFKPLTDQLSVSSVLRNLFNTSFSDLFYVNSNFILEITQSALSPLFLNLSLVSQTEKSLASFLYLDHTTNFSFYKSLLSSFNVLITLQIAPQKHLESSLQFFDKIISQQLILFFSSVVHFNVLQQVSTSKIAPLGVSVSQKTCIHIEDYVEAGYIEPFYIGSGYCYDDDFIYRSIKNPIQLIIDSVLSFNKKEMLLLSLNDSLHLTQSKPLISEMSLTEVLTILKIRRLLLALSISFSQTFGLQKALDLPLPVRDMLKINIAQPLVDTYSINSVVRLLITHVFSDSMALGDAFVKEGYSNRAIGALVSSLLMVTGFKPLSYVLSVSTIFSIATQRPLTLSCSVGDSFVHISSMLYPDLIGFLSKRISLFLKELDLGINLFDAISSTLVQRAREILLSLNEVFTLEYVKASDAVVNVDDSFFLFHGNYIEPGYFAEFYVGDFRST